MAQGMFLDRDSGSGVVAFCIHLRTCTFDARCGWCVGSVIIAMYIEIVPLYVNPRHKGAGYFSRIKLAN